MAKEVTTQYDALIQKAAEGAGIDPKLFRAQLVQESGLNPEAVSKAGAIGIGQIVPKWWKGQHGLNTPEDFRNPEKSINASAAIMSGLVKAHGGWNQALVAYNAGAGKGNKNILAFNEGRLQDLPLETQDYLKKLGTASNAAVVQADAQKATEGAPQGLPGVASSLGPGGPGSVPPGQSRTTAFVQPDAPQQGAWDSLLSGARHGAIGTALRRDDPLAQTLPSTYEFSTKDLEDVRAAGLGEAGTRFVLRNTLKGEDIPELIKLARENRTANRQERSLVGDLSYGLGEMVSDPVTYATLPVPVGVYGKASSLFSGAAARVAGVSAVAAEGALTNLASESIRESTTGTDADYASAIAAGAVFSVGLLGASKAVGAGWDSVTRGLNRVEASQTADALRRGGAGDVQDPTVLRAQDLDNLLEGPEWRQTVTASPGNVLVRMPSGDIIHPVSGTQYSSHNPMNPVYNDPVDINLSSVWSAEVGDVVASSNQPAFKSMAFDLVRSTRGYADGSSGKMGMTAQDVHKDLKGHHFDYQLKWEDLRTQAIGDPQYQITGTTLAEQRRVFDERVMRAVEADDFAQLLPAERQAAELRKARYGTLAELQVNPGGRYGVAAPSLMDSASVKANYQPVVYNEVKLGAIRDSLGDEAVRDAVQRSFTGSYLTRPDVKARVDAFLQREGRPVTPEEAHRYAGEVAYGIVNGGDNLTVGRLNLMMEQRGMSTGSAPDFRKMRSPFDYDHDVPLQGGGRFSVNDLRSWDADMIDSAYFNRVKGDVSVAVGTGRTPEQFQSWLDDARRAADTDANLKGEVLAFEKIVGGLYGIGIRNGPERLAAVQGALQDLAFIKSSAYMGLLNYAEVAAGVVKHGLGFVVKGVPGVGKLFQDLSTGKATAETLRAAQNTVWGSALDRAILPTYREAIDRATRKLWADSGNNAVNNVLGVVKGATGALAERFWTSRVLNATSGQIIEAARGEFFADLAALAHGARKSSFGSPARFKEASLTQEQFDGALQLLRDTTRIAKDGTLEVTDAVRLGNDPRVSHLRRYGQHWSEQVIQQNALGSTFRWSHLPLVGMFTQFMSFVTRSVNSRLIRGNSDILRNGNLDQALSLYVVGPMLSGVGFAGITYLQSQKYPDKDDQRKFLRERLGDEDDRGPLVAGAIKRTAMLAGPSWLYDTVGSSKAGQAIAPEVFQYAGLGKTSIDAKLKREQNQQSGPVGGFLGDAVENAPAVKMVDSLATIAGTPVRKAMAGPDWEDQQRAGKATLRAWQSLLPNDPATQYAFRWFTAE